MRKPRDLVYQTLDFDNTNRVPRQLWILPWAEMHFPNELQLIRTAFPDDIVVMPRDQLNLAEGFQVRPPLTAGNPYAEGTYLDVWGCEFTNQHSGLLGEVRCPLVVEDGWEDTVRIRFPTEALHVDKDAVNAFCKDSDKFVIAADLARPFERLQFLRGSQRLYEELLLRPTGMLKTLESLHSFYCELLSSWAKTAIDALWIMDDWGAQTNLLIDPRLWQSMFEPLYREYVAIARQYGKRIFFHSDGNILAIFPRLVDLGFDAINSQVFCMGIDSLAAYKGQITFWGEIDRQYLLAAGTEAEVEAAVRSVNEQLWSNGGCIAQCEFGAGARPQNVYKVFDTWQREH